MKEIKNRYWKKLEECTSLCNNIYTIVWEQRKVLDLLIEPVTDGMQAQISDKASNGTQPNLSMRELEKFDVQVPQNTDEQKAIGDYFNNLDHLITLHQRK